MSAVQILFEDPHLVVLSKPPGLLSQGEHTGDENLVDWLRKYFGRNYVGLVHRLDRNTSGVMVVAKRTKAADRLTQSLQKGEIERSYLGWVCGSLETAVTWSNHLLKDERTNLSTVSDKPLGGAKLAITHARPINPGRFNGRAVTLTEFILETGRSHQIRAQCAHADHPLLGDLKYGSKLGSFIPGFRRTALHSHRIRFPHPMDLGRENPPLEFTAPMPEDFLEVKTAT